MLHTLLLQASTHTSTVEVTSLTNVYLALGGTLTAAIIAALASWNAARIAGRAASLASATSEKVADLSRQTTKEVAELSAQVSRESARLAAQTAREMKETDYKHEVYRRILEKRIAAWQNAQQLVGLLFPTKQDHVDNKLFPSYFASIETLNEITEKTRLVNAELIWLGKDFAFQISHFYKIIIELKNSCISVTTPLDSNRNYIIDDESIQNAGKRGFAHCQASAYNMSTVLIHTLRHLHEIESFYELLDEVSRQEIAQPAPDAPK